MIQTTAEEEGSEHARWRGAGGACLFFLGRDEGCRMLLLLLAATPVCCCWAAALEDRHVGLWWR